MIRSACISIVLICLSGCFSNSPKLNWYRGNLHTHTYWSDGDEFPEVVLDWYQTKGYDFIALSDHNTLSADEKWVVIQKSPLYENSFQEYLKKFGQDWVEYKTDTGRIQVKLKTYQQYKQKMGRGDFLIIPSEEITDRVGKSPVHINATNLQQFIPPSGDSTVAGTMQKTIDAVLRQRQQTGVPMFPHINHPNFGWGVSVEDLIRLHGERFFEVYNGHPMVNNYGDSSHLNTEAMWDKINVAYANRNQPHLFGLATDDSHNYHEFGGAFSNAGRGWVMVQAESLDASSLIEAMEVGNFYASTGVTLETYAFDNNEIRITVAGEPGITYTIDFIGVKKNATEATVLQTIRGTDASFPVTNEFIFVRTRIRSTKPKPNPFQAGDFEMAWTQPVVSKP